MIFEVEKKNQIILYLLEKIEQKVPNLTKKVSEEFGITQNTVYTYLSELEKKNCIKKVQRGAYDLVNFEHSLTLKRSGGELESENGILVKHLRKYLQTLAPNVKNIWTYVLGEMINNVIDHSGCETLTVTVRQNILNSTFILEDDGVGIFNKIRDFYNYDTDEDIICELFKGKLTTDKKNHSGEGIFFSSRLMDYFEIASGESKYVYNDLGEAEETEGTCSGTRYTMKISNHTKKTTKEIFDLFSDIDDGFVKTIIPLKNIFEGNMVSRSQAKRICNRLEEFESVMLDFAGVDFVGQGFADQIFRVFARDNPQIKITPVNMSEDVQKMYRHVLSRAEELSLS